MNPDQSPTPPERQQQTETGGPAEQAGGDDHSTGQHAAGRPSSGDESVQPHQPAPAEPEQLPRP